MPQRTLVICAVGAGLIAGAFVVWWHQDSLSPPPSTELPAPAEFATRVARPADRDPKPEWRRGRGFWQLGAESWPLGWSRLVLVVGPSREHASSVSAIADSGSLRGLPALQYVLEHHDCGNTRRAAATGALNLASLYDDSQQKTVGRWIVEEAKRPDPHVRAAVFRGVAWDPYYRSGHFIEWLEEALQGGFHDGDSECRREAASSASRLLGALSRWSIDPPAGYLDALAECLLSASPGPRTATSLGAPYPPLSPARFNEVVEYLAPEQDPELRRYVEGGSKGHARRFLRAVRVGALVRLWEEGTPEALRLVRRSLAERPLE